MNPKKQDLVRRYCTALRAHLDSERRGRLSARVLGDRIRNAGISTLDLVQAHGHALMILAPEYGFADIGNKFVEKAGVFFTEVLMPLEEKWFVDHKTLLQLRQRAETLQVHTMAVAASNRKFKREISRRKSSEKALTLGKERYALLLAESQLMQKNLRRLAHQILSAQEDERRLISRELHDEVVQTLVGINVQLAALDRAASVSTTGLKSKIATTQRLVEKSVNAVHRFARDLRPAVLDDLGLIPALHSFMKTVASREKLRINLTAAASAEDLDSDKRTVLYRIAQEALTNVSRHARATEVNVSIKSIRGLICMEIHDNGRAFDVQRAFSAKTNKRLGLLGMRERVEMVGGMLAIDSAPGKGTTVRVEIPLSPGVAS